MHYDFIRTKEIMRNSAFYIVNRIEFRYCLLNLISFSYKSNSVVDRVQIVLILCNAVAKVCNGNRNWSAFGQPYHKTDPRIKK